MATQEQINAGREKQLAARRRPAPAAATTAAADGAALIDGTEDEVLERVAGDETKARAALDAEQAKDKPRKGVVERLEAIVGTS